MLGRYGQSDKDSNNISYYESTYFIFIMKNVQVIVLFNIHMFVLQIHSNQVRNTIKLLLPYHSILIFQWMSTTRYEIGRKSFLIFFPSKEIFITIRKICRNITIFYVIF